MLDDRAHPPFPHPHPPSPPSPHPSCLQFFWYAAQLKPQLFRGFLAAALPPPDLDLAATWASVARRSLNMLTESEVGAAGVVWWVLLGAGVAWWVLTWSGGC